jgi:hypothetical protein
MRKSMIVMMILSVLSFEVVAAESNPGQPADQSAEGISGVADRAKSMFDEIVDWLALNFDLPPTRTMPNIAFASPLELMKRRAADRAQWQGFKYDDDPASLRNVVAVYDTVTTKIYLPLNWVGTSPADQSVLVHEVVHHLQNVGRLRFECPAAREKVAYFAQDAWLRRSNISLEDEFGVDMFTIVASSACM